MVQEGGGVGLEDDQSYLIISLGCTWPLVWSKPTKFKGQGCDCLWGSQAHSNSIIFEEGSYGLTDWVVVLYTASMACRGPG